MSYQPMSTDFDQFFNYDQQDTTPLAAHSIDSKPIPTLLHQNSSSFASTPILNSGPTYRYDEHRQQTGMPMGGYANMLAVNQSSGFYRQGNNPFVVPTETFNIPLTNLSDYDFASGLGYNDMDYNDDPQADVPSMFSGVIESPNVSPVAVSQPQRIFPGIHTMQAAQKMQQHATQQKPHVPPNRVPAGQKPLPINTPVVPKTEAPAHLNLQDQETISKVISRYRQSSSASAELDEDAEDNGRMADMSKLKREEDDMDADEKLLNSEEGKKLSSKERRQLRNKVSARAFRSRRKEYIGVLEGDISKKAEEIATLTILNTQLKEENTRLTDLTRMLLSSPSFSGFLQELSKSGDATVLSQQANSQRSAAPQRPSQPVSQPAPPKDVATYTVGQQHQNAQHYDMTVGMTLIPDLPLDVAMLQRPMQWGSTIPTPDNYHAFAVTQLPEPPNIDVSKLSGKPLAVDSAIMPTLGNKNAIQLSSTPSTTSRSCRAGIFDKEHSCRAVTLPLVIPPVLSATLSKTNVAAEILQSQNTVQGTDEELREMCSTLDEITRRIAKLLP